MNDSISIGIMTFNEARCIERCIESIKYLADEIIIMDTGSTDKTVDIILRLQLNKIKLFKVKWKNDFSEIRNLMIEKSTGDIIFQIDADEYLNPQQSLLEIKKNIENIEFNTVGIPRIINEDSIELGKGPVRIFKNFCGYFFYGCVHEEVRNEKKFYKNIIDIQIFHDGYNHKVATEKNKGSRNINLSKKMMNKEPKNPRWRFHYIRDLFFYEKDKTLILGEINSFIQDFDIYQKDEFLNILKYLEIIKYFIEIVFTEKEYFDFKNLEDKYPNSIDIIFLKLLFIQKKLS